MAGSSMRVTATYAAAQRFEVTSASGLTVSLDGEHRASYSPMEMLLACLASCSGLSVISILQKKQEAVAHYELQVLGVHAETHPLVFVEISVEHIITGHHVLQPQWNVPSNWPRLATAASVLCWAKRRG